MSNQESVNRALKRLSYSKFRSSFHLSKKEKDYVKVKGMDVIEAHARDFIAKRLAPAHIENDGKQTPMRGHPVFVAQHACGCCCRGCLKKWYHVPDNRPLTDKEQASIVMILMGWIRQEMGE